MNPVGIPTRAGSFTARFSVKGLASLAFPRAASGKRLGAASAPKPSRWITLTALALREALDARKPKRLPPLDLSAGTPFQRRVWQELRRIPPGRTRTYAEIATRIGHPQAARAVGQACGANPVPVLIPCHRVVAAGGRMGGFSGGLHWKKKLLRLEQAPR